MITYKSGITTIGSLTYEYDNLGRQIKMGGPYARVAIPNAVTSATYDNAVKSGMKSGLFNPAKSGLSDPVKTGFFIPLLTIITSHDLPCGLGDEVPASLRGKTLNEINRVCKGK
jgi:hypothetical protein